MAGEDEVSRRRPAAILAAVAVLLLLANFVFTAHYVNSTQAAEHRQGLAVEQKICATLGKLASLQPPAGDPADNPSRAFEQRLHATLDQLAPDLGCRR